LFVAVKLQTHGVYHLLFVEVNAQQILQDRRLVFAERHELLHLLGVGVAALGFLPVFGNARLPDRGGAWGEKLVQVRHDEVPDGLLRTATARRLAMYCR